MSKKFIDLYHKYKKEYEETGKNKILYTRYYRKLKELGIDIHKKNEIIEEKNTNDVLVFLPTYNRINNIHKIIGMIQNQTYKNIDLYIINDGSDIKYDKTWNDIIEKYKGKNIIFSKNDKNIGIAKTINKGIQYFLKNNNYSYFTWISDDNIYNHDFIKILRKDNIYFNYSFFELCDKIKRRKRIIQKVYNTVEDLVQHFEGCASFMWTKDAINNIGYYNENIDGCEDYEYLIRTFLYNFKDIVVKDVSTMIYERTNNSLFIRKNNEIMNLKENIIKIFNYLHNNNDNFIYYSKIKYEILCQRPHQIMKHFSKTFNKIFIGDIDNVKYEENNNLLVVPYQLKECIFHFMNNSKCILYYTDSRLFDEVKKLNKTLLYDLIDAPINEFEVWKPNLEKCIKQSDEVMYSHPDLNHFLNEIDSDKTYHYISNACDDEHFSKSKERIGKRPSEFPKTEKPILGYYGSFAEWLDYDMIRKYANNGQYHIVMIGGIQGNPKYNIRFNHPNITWIDHKPYKELPYYLSWFDKCFLPFKDCELTKYVNPCKLWEYMVSGKEIIKYNVNMDSSKIVTYKSECEKIKKIMKHQLSIVILCYNYLEYTKQCIDSVLRNTVNDSYELIIVNNGSTDGTTEYLNDIKNKEDNIKVIHNESNLGFSKGMNIGMKNTNGEYLILLNNDTIVGEGWDYSMVELLKKDERIFAVTPVTNFSGNDSMIKIEHNSPQYFFEKVKSLRTHITSNFDTNSLALFCGCFRNSDMINIGYLDENYYNGWEDDDLYERILICKKKVVTSTDSIVYHFGSITVGNNAYSDDNNKNKLYFEKKWNKKWISKYNKKNVYSKNKTDVQCNFLKYILVTGNDDGGSYFFIQNNLKYFTLIKNKNDFERTIINQDTVIFINSFLLSNVSIDFMVKMKIKYNCKIIIIVHDYYWFCDELYYHYNPKIHNIYLDKKRKCPPHILKLFDIVDKIIFSDTSIFENISHLLPNIFKKKYIIDSSLWLENETNKTSFKIPSTKIINNTINIGVFVILDECKGKEQVDFLKNNIRKYKNYNINYYIVGDNIERYKNNNTDFIKLVNKYNINGFLLLNKWGETWCYSLSRFMLTKIPIFYNNFGVFKNRIEEDNKLFFKNNENENEYYNFNLLRENYENFLNGIVNKNVIQNKKKILKFVIYFPQFHEIPENSLNFYKGYDDNKNLHICHNVLFEENKIDYRVIKQDNEYLDNIEYNCLDDKLIDKQIDLLKRYHIDGIAMYYYWFSENTITNKNLIMFDVIEKFLEKDMNIYFIWANECWTNNKAFGDNTKNIIKNNFDDINSHCEFLLRCFKNKNYYKINNKPLLYIHHPWEIKPSDLNKFYMTLDSLCKENNFNGIHLKLHYSLEEDKKYNCKELEFQYKFYDFHPKYKEKNKYIIPTGKENCSVILNYKKYVDSLQLKSNTQTIFFDFDNYTRLVKPNNLKYRTKCINNDYIDYIKYISKIQDFFDKTPYNEDDPFMLLINSFNEWGEKMHIEPSNLNETFYLDLIYNFF